MDKQTQPAVANYLIAMGDDELILGQRDGEWCGHAPILEEDIAFANISLDEIGHANVWYQLAADLLHENKHTYPDWLAFRRPSADFRSIQMVALPKGDWAFSMLRQYLFDSFEFHHLAALRSSQHKPLADAAAKIRNEEIYHLRHTRSWVQRLALGTDESNSRMQAALDELWSYVQQVGAPTPGHSDLAKAGFVPDSDKLRIAWTTEVSPFLAEISLVVPSLDAVATPRRAEHSQHFEELVEEMQEVPRLYPEGVW